MAELTILKLLLVVSANVGAFASETAIPGTMDSEGYVKTPPSDLSTLSRSNGPALSIKDMNTGLTPKRGYFVWRVPDPNHCIVENVRDLDSLPGSLSSIRKTIKDLSFGKDGKFAEAACWVFVYEDDKMESECVRMSSGTAGSGKEINAPLQKLIKRSRSADYAKNVVMIHTHPTDFNTRHFGPSQPDLGLHYSMERQFAESHGLPLGSYISLVFPVDRESKTDFYYSVSSFKSVGQSCPKNPGE